MAAKVEESNKLLEEARLAQSQGELQRAEQLLLQAAEKNPQAPEICRQHAEVLLAAGQIEAAIQKLSQAATLNPDDSRAYTELAELLYLEKRYAEASRPLNAALRLDPVNIPALMLEAKLEEQRQRFELALETYHRILKVDPNNIDAKLRIAALQAYWRKPEKAAPLLRTVLQNPEATLEQRAEASWILGMTYGRDRRWVDAVESLSQAVEHKAKMTADDWYRLAYAAYRSHNVGTLQQALRRSLQTDRQHANTFAMARVLNLGPANLPTANQDVIQVGHADKKIPIPAGW